MSDRQREVDRYEGWDQEKNASFERVTCPVCGYRAVFYDDGDVVVEHERDPHCTCCVEVDNRDVVVPYDYGTSSGDNDDDFGCVGCFMALLILPIIIVLFMVNVLGMFH